MNTYCGFIAIVGRPNVGKSTLLNALLGNKISITSRKPQTTRHRILGILTEDNAQFVFVDTPGIHQHINKPMNKAMNKAAYNAMKEVDAILFVIEGTRFTEEDEAVLQAIRNINIPTILLVNKVDKLNDKAMLLPFLQKMEAKFDFKALLPVSATKKMQLDKITTLLKPYIHESPFFYDKAQLTDRHERFLCAELVREKVFRFSGDELPYATAVEIESFKEEDKLFRIHALIWVEKPSHKAMIIGEKGSKLKQIATEARLAMEKLLDKKVFLVTHCKVKEGWSLDARLIKQMGYDEN
jgi:GTP-binding protein Era